MNGLKISSIKDSHEMHVSIIILSKKCVPKPLILCLAMKISDAQKREFMKCDNYIFAYYENGKKTSHFQSDSKSMNTTD